ncbi:NAD(P)-dependent oxidoreductase [Mycobacterium shigaense]|uniref:NAD(P)-dependent oxidoreductase n=1 Tax=Mycobacterium shigaense TaxID=722731 RepID=UPI002ADFEEC6|nr:NAD(P)-dependent oxidoreductase [Mycobacterium shigaense]MEA1120536.1 NAD(P)-dependent oxidoreductase [Mycobacterium shigaense]
MRVGFIGAGRMGRPMVARLVAGGHDVTALGRTVGQRRDLERLGVHAVGELADAVARADVVTLCVFTDEQVREICLESALLTVMPAGSTLVVHTTTTPTTIEAISARAGRVAVIDAPVSGGPHDVARGTLTLFVGGSGDAVGRLLPLLSCYADPILQVGPSGAGQKVKLVNNALFAGQLGLLAESVRLGEQLGVPQETVLAALAHGSATSRALDIVAARGSVASFIEVAGEFVGKDVAVVREITEKLGGDLGVLGDVIEVVGGGGGKF